MIVTLRGWDLSTDFQSKAEKYESKAAKCKEWADQTQGVQREFYDVLTFFYGDLALAFRQAIARRSGLSSYLSRCRSR